MLLFSLVCYRFPLQQIKWQGRLDESLQPFGIRTDSKNHDKHNNNIFFKKKNKASKSGKIHEVHKNEILFIFTGHYFGILEPQIRGRNVG